MAIIQNQVKDDVEMLEDTKPAAVADHAEVDKDLERR